MTACDDAEYGAVIPQPGDQNAGLKRTGRGGGPPGRRTGPATAETAWQASRETQPRARGADDPFCRRLGERVGRTWLGSRLAADHGSPPHDFTAAIARARRREVGPPGRRDHRGI
ncbi:MULTISPECIES: hypothetical protein [Streptomyces]|uniref:Uncharacterized protein n=1 Tax=Streptomyces fimbriatus TaxID=68197 RepID=A0ABW0DH83_STRFI